MLFLTRLKVMLKRKSTLFWVLLFPILLASAEYFAFGKFIHSTPIETISIGFIEEDTPELLQTIFKEAQIDENKKLYEIKVYKDIELARVGLEEQEIDHFLYEQDGQIKVVAKSNGTELMITESIIDQSKQIEHTIQEAYQRYEELVLQGENPQPVDVLKIIENLTMENSYFKDLSTKKTATFYTFYFYSLLAMSCLYAALFGVSIIQDIRADRSNLGIRISSSVVSKGKLLLSYFAASCLLQAISATIICIYLKYILKIGLGGNLGLIFLTLILGGISGIAIGMLIGTFVKGSEAKVQGIVTAITLSSSCLAGLMAVDVKHIVDKYVPFVNYINPASLISNSLYALYYYDTYSSYLIFTSILACFSILALGIVIFKMRGEKYASL